MVEEGVLAAILATLASAMNVLAELLEQMPPEFSRTQPLTITLDRLTGLAQEICGECVPHTYTPRLIFWMDRIQATALRIKYDRFTLRLFPSRAESASSDSLPRRGVRR